MKVEILREPPDASEPPDAAVNPFLTRAYARYRQAIGESACLVRLPGQELKEGLIGFLRRGRFGDRLEMPSLPLLPMQAEWWRDLLCSLRRAGVVVVGAGTFASPAGAGPPDGVGGRSRARHEFILSLDRDPLETMSAGHRRNVRRGARAGLVLRHDGDPEAHHALSAASLRRRRDRGEHAGPGIGVADARAALASGVARILQARAGDEVLSSIEVLMAPRGAYYHSAGTSPDGMATGASHWLLHAVATLLRTEGVLLFNLGGAEPTNPGLWRFKNSFGAEVVPTRAATFSLVPRLLRPLSLLMRRPGPG